MPFVIVETGNVPVGWTFDAILCDANIAGLPDHRTAVPVQVTLIREGRTLKVEPDDRRDIVSVVSQDGTMSFAVSPGRKALVASVRPARLAQASELLRQLAQSLRPLTAESKEPGCATEGLGLLFDWLSRETEREKVPERSPR